MIEITPKFEQNSGKSLYIQLYEHIKVEILCGRIIAGEKLPSVRGLSQYLGISKNTVEGAYEQLIDEGYARSRQRSGLYVEEIEGSFDSGSIKSSFKTQNDEIKYKDIDFKYDFSNGQIDQDSFPYKIWRRIFNRCIDPRYKELLLYGEHQGDEDLRIQIAKYLHESRGVNCHYDQILIGSGTQQSLSMLCTILQETQRIVAMEEPGYRGARAVFTHYNFEVKPVHLKEDGISIEDIKKSKAKIVYITPSHQFPNGMVMPVAKRIKLLQWAFEEKGLIIEDDYDGEFRYHGKPIPSLQGLDTWGNTIYLGTFSKSLIPSIRISYMVLPERILEIYKQNYRIYEQPVPRINQKALQIFMEEGDWERHIRKMRNIYRKKHDTLLYAISTVIGSNVEIIGKDAGLHVLLKVKNNMDEQELIKSAELAKVMVSPTSIYWMNNEKSKSSIIFLGFGGIALSNICKGVELLNKAWFDNK